MRTERFGSVPCWAQASRLKGSTQIGGQVGQQAGQQNILRA